MAHSLSDKPLPPSPLIPTSLEGGKVSDRLSQLKCNSENWKQRIGKTSTHPQQCPQLSTLIRRANRCQEVHSRWATAEEGPVPRGAAVRAVAQ